MTEESVPLTVVVERARTEHVASHEREREAHDREHAAHEHIHLVEKAQVEKAEQAMNRRLEGMNEFRSALADQAARSITREYYDARHEALRERVTDGDKALDDKIAVLEAFRGKALGFSALIALLSGVAGAIIGKAIG